MDRARAPEKPLSAFVRDTFRDEDYAFDLYRMGEGFVAVELEQADGNPASPLPQHHSVLTLSLVDAPGEPTRDALERVLALFRERLLDARA